MRRPSKKEKQKQRIRNSTVDIEREAAAVRQSTLDTERGGAVCQKQLEKADRREVSRQGQH